MIEGQSYATGVERIRATQLHGSKPETAPSQWVAEALYNHDIWGAMTGQNPAPGATVGCFVAAGDTRANAMNTLVLARTQTVWFLWPADTGADPVQTA